MLSPDERQQIAKQRAAKLETAQPGYFATIGAKGGSKSGSRPLRDRPGYASELAKRRWDKYRENLANDQKPPETPQNP